jgi:hypothetical protein
MMRPDEVEMVNAFSSVFRSGNGKICISFMKRSIRNMFGFTTRYSGWKIICACAQTHQQVKKKSLADTSNFGFTAPMEASSKTRNRHSISELNCPMHVNCTPLVRHVKGDTFRKQDKILSRLQEHHSITIILSPNKCLLKQKKPVINTQSDQKFSEKRLNSSYDKCFVRLSAVVRWISKTDTNRKRVIMGMDK